MDDLKLLPKPEKQVVAKVLNEKGLSLREVGALLGLDASTIMRYCDKEIPEELQQFATIIQEKFKTNEDRVAAKALGRIEEKIATARINEALEVYKTMRGQTQEIVDQRVIPIINIQINENGVVEKNEKES